MKELVFESSLSPEEIEDNFKDFDFFTAMMKSLSEAVAYQNGKLIDGVVVHEVSVPDGAGI